MGVQPNVPIRGHSRRPLLESEIKHAQSVTRSGAEAARFLRVQYNTYKKYAKLYGIFDEHVNQSGRQISRRKFKGVFGLESILNGEHPTYSRTKLKERLIAAGYLRQSCGLCGFHELRIVDGRCPLILHHVDDDYNNFSLSNLQLRCYNCTYLTSGKISVKRFNIGVHDQDLLDRGFNAEDIAELQREIMRD
jgi:hypothetical protein